MTHRKRIFLVVPLLLAFLVAGWWGWKEYQRTHIKTEAEVVKYYAESNSALAVTTSGELFTFSFPNTDQATGADLTRTGTLLVLTGADYWLLSYPMSYPSVSNVEYAGKREDFVKKYLDTLVQQHKSSTPQQVEDAIAALSDLNEGEKEGLAYLVMGELGIW